MRAPLASALALVFALSSCDEAPTRVASPTPAPVRIQVQRSGDLDTATWNRTYGLSITATDDQGVVRTERIFSPQTRRISWTLRADLGQNLLVYGLTDSWNAKPETLWVATADIGTDEPSLDTALTVTLVAHPFVSGMGAIAGRGVADFVLFSPTPESFVNPVSVRMATRTGGASVRYALGSENPSASSFLAPESLLLDGTTTITAIAYHPSLFPSEPSTRTFRFRVDTLRPSRLDSIFPESTAVRWTTATRGAVLRYRTDNTDPDSTSPVLAGAFSIDSVSRSIRVRGFREGYDPSPVFRRTYRITVPTPKLQVLDERFPESDGNHRAQLFPMASSLRIHYTLDGSSPDTSDPRTDQEIPLDRSSRLRVVAYGADGRRGAELDTFLVLSAPSIQLDAVSGVFQAPLRILRPDLPSNFRAGYTLDGTDPDSLSPTFPETLLVDRDARLTVRAMRSGWKDGAVWKDSFQFVNTPIALSVDTGIVYDRAIIPLREPTSRLDLRCAFGGTSAQADSPPCPDSLVLDSATTSVDGGLRVSIRSRDPSLPTAPPAMLEASWIWGSGRMTDARDGSIYSTILIDGFADRREWMATDMRYAIADSSECWPAEAGGCAAGRNYAKTLVVEEFFACWPTPGKECSDRAPRNVCPEGWRIPTVSELGDLENFAQEVQSSPPVRTLNRTFRLEPLRCFTEFRPEDLPVVPQRWATTSTSEWSHGIGAVNVGCAAYLYPDDQWRPVRCVR